MNLDVLWLCLELVDLRGNLHRKLCVFDGLASLHDLHNLDLDLASSLLLKSLILLLLLTCSTNLLLLDRLHWLEVVPDVVAGKLPVDGDSILVSKYWLLTRVGQELNSWVTQWHDSLLEEICIQAGQLLDLCTSIRFLRVE